MQPPLGVCTNPKPQGLGLPVAGVVCGAGVTKVVPIVPWVPGATDVDGVVEAGVIVVVTTVASSGARLLRFFVIQ